MESKLNIWLLSFSFSFLVASVSSHGYMIEPPQRSSLWRVYPGQGFEPNYDDMGLFCGGFFEQWEVNDGKCGVCGDPYEGERQNEAGGKYATGFITRQYNKGQDIDVEVILTANHLGYFQFRLCPHNDVNSPINQNCLDQHVLKIAGQPGVTEYKPGNLIGSHHIKVTLPSEITCEQCVLQWKYTTGNSYNCEKNTNTCCLGCGPQETFINCADIAIVESGAFPTVKPTLNPVPVTNLPTTSAATSASIPITSTTETSDLFDTFCDDTEILTCIGNGVENEWCNIHCRAGSEICTPNYCDCNCQPPGVRCVGVGLFYYVHGIDEWCLNNCPYSCEEHSDICHCTYP